MKKNSSSIQVSANHAAAMKEYRDARLAGSTRPWGMFSSALVTKHQLQDDTVPTFKAWAKMFSTPESVIQADKGKKPSPATTAPTTDPNPVPVAPTTPPVQVPLNVGPITPPVPPVAPAKPAVEIIAPESTNLPAKQIDVSTMLYVKENALPDVLVVKKGANAKQALTTLLSEQAQGLKRTAKNNPSEWIVGGYIATRGEAEKKGDIPFTLESANVYVRDEKQAYNIVNRMVAKMLFTGKLGAIFAFCGTGTPIVMSFNLR